MEDLDVRVVAQDFALWPPALVWTLAHRAHLGSCLFFGAPFVDRRQALHRTGASALARAGRCGGRVIANVVYWRPGFSVCLLSWRPWPACVGPAAAAWVSPPASRGPVLAAEETSPSHALA